MTEHAIKKAVMAYLKKVQVASGGLLIARKTHGTAFSTAGDPDIIGAFMGFAFVIELKQPGKAPTKIQEARLAEWRITGAKAGVATSVSEVRDLLNLWFGKQAAFCLK
jgi:hypothetical protein